jgi:hypothetical protein
LRPEQGVVTSPNKADENIKTLVVKRGYASFGKPTGLWERETERDWKKA